MPNFMPNLNPESQLAKYLNRHSSTRAACPDLLRAAYFQAAATVYSVRQPNNLMG